MSRQTNPNRGKRHNVYLPPHVSTWLAKTGNASAKIVELVEKEIEREKQNPPR